MKKTIATPLDPPPRTCVITEDSLDATTLFVLQCCEQDISKEVIMTWFKQSETKGCPCCRDLTKARDALTKLGVDLTPMKRPASPPENTNTRVIFDAVLAGIAEQPTIKIRCQQYREFGLGLMTQNQRGLAHDLIDHLGGLFDVADSESQPKIAKIILVLLDRYEGREQLAAEQSPRTILQKWAQTMRDMLYGARL